jgi:hypothetical protein
MAQKPVKGIQRPFVGIMEPGLFPEFEELSR